MERKSISPAIRNKVYARDNHRCRKCHRTKKLHLHHIIPVAQEQIDTEENLITLCNHCHDEWEHIIYAQTTKLDFYQWLEIPPAAELVVAFTNGNQWTDDITAKDARNSILKAYSFIRDLRQYNEVDGK